ncbi:unnamed protein product [Protopolystoma xenopodis]|uniref:Uncharacterized protein n=1 Tax=Protopolystoma xenopodis TaxID=117903 RepID=A0A448X5V4_9PLAT|nr:unnamed protein product [Protopolystoma xenopodis]
MFESTHASRDLARVSRGVEDLRSCSFMSCSVLPPATRSSRRPIPSIRLFVIPASCHGNRQATSTNSFDSVINHQISRATRIAKSHKRKCPNILTAPHTTTHNHTPVHTDAQIPAPDSRWSDAVTSTDRNKGLWLTESLSLLCSLITPQASVCLYVCLSVCMSVRVCDDDGTISGGFAETDSVTDGHNYYEAATAAAAAVAVTPTNANEEEKDDDD